MKKVSIVMMTCLLVLVFVSCDDGGGGSGDGYGNATILDGTWSRSSGYYKLKFSGYYWVYEENGSDYARGTWSTAFALAAPSSGTVAFTATNINNGYGWGPFPNEYAGIQTNTASFSINNAGNVLTISGAQYKTSGIWGTTEGTYTKQ